MENKLLKIIRVVAACHIISALGASVFIVVIWASKHSIYDKIESGMLTAGFLTLRLLPGGVLHLLVPKFGSNISARFALTLSWGANIAVLSSLLLLGELSSGLEIACFGILITLSSLVTPISASTIRQTPLALRQYLNESKSTTLIVGATPWIFGFVVSFVSFLLDNYDSLALIWIIATGSAVFGANVLGIENATVLPDKKENSIEEPTVLPKEIYTSEFKLLMFATAVYYFCYGVFEIGMIQNLTEKTGEMTGIGMFWALFTVGAAGIMLLQFNFKYSNHLIWISSIILCWSVLIVLFPFADGWQMPVLAFILGGSFAPYAIICNTYINRITTPKTRSITYKTWSSILLFPTPAGIMAGGFLISILHDESTLILSGAVLLVLSIIVFIQSKRKSFEFVADPNKTN